MNAPGISTPEVVFAPAASAWAGLIADPLRDPRCAEVRAALGLPTDRPIVMSGHQASFWHPGIAAKLLAGRSLGARTGSEVVWLIVDTVDDEPFEVGVPRLASGSRLEAGRLALAPSSAGMPTGLRPAVPAAGLGTVNTESLAEGFAPRVARMRDALRTNAGAPSAAVQVTVAAVSLLACAPPLLTTASALAGTAAFGSFAEAFRRGVDRLGMAHNGALAGVSGSGVAPLDVARGEMPFWRVAESGARRAALAGDPPGATLWPRALLTTGFARAFACDLFIHGTGGGAYEPVNDGWLGGALGVELAPFVTVTATLRLRLGDGPIVTDHDAAQAARRAHRSRHHPNEVGDAVAQSERDALVAAIAAARPGSGERLGLYRDLQRLLAAHRERNSGAIDAVRAAARDARGAADEARVRQRRDWPAALHEPDDLRRLASAVDAAFDVGERP